MSNLTGNALRDIFAMQSSSSIKEVRENANAVLAEFARLERELATARADYACLNQTYRDMMHWYGERGRKIAELEKSADVEYAVARDRTACWRCGGAGGIFCAECPACHGSGKQPPPRAYRNGCFMQTCADAGACCFPSNCAGEELTVHQQEKS